MHRVADLDAGELQRVGAERDLVDRFRCAAMDDGGPEIAPKRLVGKRVHGPTVDSQRRPKRDGRDRVDIGILQQRTGVAKTRRVEWCSVELGGFLQALQRGAEAEYRDDTCGCRDARDKR